MGERDKRRVSTKLKTILHMDAYLTETFIKSIEAFMPMKQLKVHYRALEISCHGIPWFISVLALIWILNTKSLYQMQVNLLMGLLLDIVFIAILKAITRRRRPTVNNDMFAIGPDKYSFPSGHASRSMFVLYFFTHLWIVPTICIPPLLVWTIAVCLSRLLMRRHHILDICMGMLLGVLEGMLVSSMYLDHETCVNLISWVTDEKIDGAEYDI